MALSALRGIATVVPPRFPVSKIYSNVNWNKPEVYWNYYKYNIVWGSPQRYEVVDRVGRGKYSTVFEGRDVETQEKVSIKVLKTVPYAVIQREISILHHLEGVESVSKLLDTVQDPVTKAMSLVLKWQESVPFRQFYRSLKSSEIQSYCRSLLVGLDAIHSRGIMHRDIKPSNVLFDPSSHSLHIIDFGLSEYYFPSVQYNTRVASRCYKAPEILIHYGVLPFLNNNISDPPNQKYSYSMDMWGFGCILASLIFQEEQLFHGVDVTEQLSSISKVLGTQGLKDFCSRYKTTTPPQIQEAPIKPWTAFLNEKNASVASTEALDLISKCLIYDPAIRLTAREALEHPFLAISHQDYL